jgi:peptide/nickel transport system permease protein
MNTFKNTFREILRYPSAVAGVTMVLLLILVSIYALIKIPYNQAIYLWRGGEDVWGANPKFAAPSWYNFFSTKKEPLSFAVSTANGAMTKTVTSGAQNSGTINISYTFDYQYDDYPQEVLINFDAKYAQKQPFVSINWVMPDGSNTRIDNLGITQQQSIRFSQDQQFVQSLSGEDPIQSLFNDPKTGKIEKGKYQIQIVGITFEKGSDINAQFVLQGQVYGLAGTDQYRRDLMVALLWGAPVALAFGLLASIGTLVTTMIIAAVGTWYGGLVDAAIQRITEINLVLPYLAILIMVGTFYSHSIWAILGVTILLSIFTGSIKTYRAIFVQVKESMYIEAARSYGASNKRIIFLYLIPRMIPLLIPGLVSSVPAFVFLESTLAVLGLGDPVLPTWGKIIDDAFTNGALYKGYYYWILEPAVLLMITGLGFAMLGFALDRIFNPRLRDI